MVALLTASALNVFFVALAAVLVAAAVLAGTLIVARATVIVAARVSRTVMVATRGWPPPHLDADGDLCCRMTGIPVFPTQAARHLRDQTEH